MTKLIIYSDGGARGNPGPAGIGYAIFDSSNQVLRQRGEYIGDATNNQAEYRALIAALTEAAEMGADSVSCFMDSELIVKQLHGKYKVREENLKQLIGQVLRLSKSFAQIEYTHVLREKNKLADKLVNEALGKAGF